jgi:hypothetical protein
VAKTNAIETLVVAGFLRGARLEATLADMLGPRATLSSSAVSRVCQAIVGVQRPGALGA